VSARATGSTLRAAVPTPARTAAKRILRAYGVATSPIRPLPDFLIIGAKRGGTTSLFRYLLEHPCVAPLFPSAQRLKGAHFFDVRFDRGTAWYRSHFPSLPYRGVVRATRGCEPQAGEASPYYLAHPAAAARARKVVPGARLIVLLRDPVDRAYSHYRERVRHGDEDLSFEEALDREPERLNGEVERLIRDPHYHSHAHEHHGYVAQGLYAEHLGRWLDLFPRSQLLVLFSELLFADPAGVYADVLRFLGLRPWEPDGYPALNFHPPREDMRPATRERLARFFASHDARLPELLGVDIPWSP
jgi:hypothetical protein